MNKTLDNWLDDLALRHPTHAIRMGLDSMRAALPRLSLSQPSSRVVTIAGTNGKGSCLMVLERLCLATGMRTGSFQSPHVQHFCERIRINGNNVREDEITRAFALIDKHCADLKLTFFEWNTLAALLIFDNHQLDIRILEVGLGGRLDAVNIIDNDMAIITAIDYDHMHWLGDTLEKIATEKAGIIRPNSTVISHCDLQPIQNACTRLGARALYLNRHFTVKKKVHKCLFKGIDNQGEVECTVDIPKGCRLDNLALATQAYVLLDKLPTPDALKTLKLPARQQVIQHGNLTLILDVAHNLASIRALAHMVTERGQKAVALVGMLADKSPIDNLRTLFPDVVHWHLLSLTGARAQSAAQLQQKLKLPDATLLDNPEQIRLHSLMRDTSLLVAFGSFHTCAHVLRLLELER